MLMESVQGLSFSNIRTRRLEKVGELLDKQVTTSVEVSSPPLPAAIYSTFLPSSFDGVPYFLTKGVPKRENQPSSCLRCYENVHHHYS